MHIRRVHRLCLVLSLVALSPIGSSSTAFAEHSSIPLLHSETGDGPIWASYRVSTDGALVEGYSEAYKIALPTQVGAAAYDAEDRLLAFAAFTGVPSANGVYADVNPAPGQNIHIELLQPRPELNFIALRLRINDPERDDDPVTGEVKILLWAIGETKRTILDLRGEEGAAHIATKTGHRSFLHISEDFTGLANLRAGGNAVVPYGYGDFVGAHANVQTSITEQVEGTLVGFFHPVSVASANEISADTPSGPRDCPCFFRNFVEGSDKPAGPGPYTFHLTGAGAGGGLGEILLSGVDAALPQEADLGLAGIVAELPAQLPVDEEVEVTVRILVKNHGPGSIDARVTTAASAVEGATIWTRSASDLESIALGETREVEQTFTLACLEPGPHTFHFDAEVEPADAGDTDPNPANDSAERSVSVECVET